MTRTFTRRDCGGAHPAHFSALQHAQQAGLKSWLVEASSSRKRVPPSAASNRPARSRSAPVKAPRICPNSSDSSKVSVRPEQFTERKGRRLRWLNSWMARATSSFPVPDSPSNQHVDIGAGRLGNQLVNRHHGGAPAHQTGSGEIRRRVVGLIACIGLPPRVKMAAQQSDHGRDIERFADKIGRAARHRIHGRFERALRRHQHDRDVGVGRAQRVHQFQTSAIGHVDVAQNGVVPGDGQRFQGFAAGSDAGDGETVKRQACLQHQTDGAFIVGDQDSGRAGQGFFFSVLAASSTGIRKVNVEDCSLY